MPKYVVKNSILYIHDCRYTTELKDGNYIIRKLTPIEAERLQTLPDNYTFGVSDNQRFKAIGNGWTADVIIHILKGIQIKSNEKLIVLSMYDGIGTGRYCLEKIGVNNIEYYATEINPYSIKIAKKIILTL